MSRAPVKVAVVGGGLIGKRHLFHVNKCPDTELVGLVELFPSGEATAKEHNTNYYKTVEDILASKDKPEFAIIAVPNDSHVPVASAFINAGVHVLVEKPIAVDNESGWRLVNLAKEKNVKLLVGHHRRFNPYTVAAKKAIDSGELGEITAISGLWTLIKPEDYFEGHLAWRSKAASGGVLAINLIHDVDLLHFFLGPIVRVYAEEAPKRREFEVEEGAAITLRFASGAVGTFLISDNVVSPFNFEAGTGENPMIPYVGDEFYKILGTKGSLVVPQMKKYFYAEGKDSWLENLSSETLPVAEGLPFDFQISHVAKIARGEEEPSCTGENGMAALIVVEAVKKSLETKLPVDIEIMF